MNTTKSINKTDVISGYELAKIVNERLRVHHLKEIPAQMIYNYVSKGYIKSVNRDGRKMIEVDEANRWFDNYIETRIKKSK